MIYCIWLYYAAEANLTDHWNLTFSLSSSFKTYIFEQINRIILWFYSIKNIMFCKTKCALIMHFDNI